MAESSTTSPSPATKSWADQADEETIPSPSSTAETPTLNVDGLTIDEDKKSSAKFLDDPDDSNIQAVTSGDTPYTSAATFEELSLSAELLKGLYVEMKFQKPSKIQAVSLPMILNPPNRDLIAQAHNGSGKTTCFVLGMLSRVDPTLQAPQALCICPTRELAIQNIEVLRKMGKYTGISSECAVPMDRRDSIPISKRSPIMAQIVIGTPGTVQNKHHSSKGNIRIAIILASVGAAVMIAFVLLAYHRTQAKEFHGRSEFGGQTTGGLSRASLFKFHSNALPPSSSASFSNDHLLISNSRSLSGQQSEFITEISEHGLSQGVATSSAPVIPNLMDNPPMSSGRKSSPSSPLSSSPRFIEACEKPVMLDVYSPDRLAGELFFLDSSLAFTAEELSRAPAEVLGRSSHGTLYKATLDSGHMLTVKWLRVGLVKHKKEFAREVKRIGSMRHPNIVPLRAYYWGPREQERLLLADYIQGDNLALHLYETTPRRYSPLSFSQRIKVAVDVARCLLYLHDRGLPHGNLKPTNILLAGPDYGACLTDYGLHRLMTPAGVAEQILNLGALGYRAPELASASKPLPSFKADVYALGVILMELLTRKSAGDIISGQSGAVDLTDWVRLCEREGRVMDCIDRDIAGGEESSKEMDQLLATSLRCILPVHERPNIRQVFEDLCSIPSA